MLPSNLQPLAVGECLNKGLQGVELARSLQPLAFGECLDQGLHVPSRDDAEGLVDNVRMGAYACLQSLTLGDSVSQGLRVLRGRGQPAASDLQRLRQPELASSKCLLNSLQPLTFGECFNQCCDAGQLAAIDLPSALTSAAAQTATDLPW